jgi:hypothetical protein
MPDGTAKSLKQKLVHELLEYGINVVYLTFVFASFTQYRRLLLAAHDISYTNYWFAVIQALILGKVIMVGVLFRFGRSFEQRPLIVATLYNAVIFTVLVGAFTLIEHGISGLWNGVGLNEGISIFLDKGVHEILANSLVVFVALVPFFAVKELALVLGKEKIWALFFRSRRGD